MLLDENVAEEAAPVQSETQHQRNLRAAAQLTLEELQEYVDNAAAGALVVVPDGLPEVIRRLRADLTMALGPQEAGDLVPVFRALENRIKAVEFGLGEIAAAQRWTLGYWLARIAAWIGRQERGHQ